MAVQLKHGYDFNDFIGTFKSPASTALAAGLFVEIADASTIGVAEGVTANDGAYILLQKVTTDGPSYQEIVNNVIQHEVKAGDPVTIVPRKRGAIIVTDQINSGSDTGPIAADTALGTELGMEAGKLRVAQENDIKVGILRGALSSGKITVELY